MNRKHEQELAPIRKRLHELKKQGSPAIPNKPDSKADESERNTYKEAVKAFNQYASAEFTRNSTVYELCKRLTKISALYDKQAALQEENPPKDLSKKNRDELHKEIKAARDEPNTKDGDESVTLGFAKYTHGFNLDHPSDVTRLLQQLRNENPQVDLFFQRDNISKGKIRFTDSAIIALAATLQRAISEFAQHAMQTTINVQKKIMYPDHCVSEGLENCSLYPLFCNLPTFKLVVNRQARRAQWEVDFKAWKATNARNKGKKAATKKAKKSTDTTKPAKSVTPDDKKPEFESFEERELSEGYAVTYERKDQRGQKKVVYLWKGLDDLNEADDDENVEADANEDENVELPTDDEESRKFGFNFYIAQVCKELKEANSTDDNGDEYDNVRVSTNIKRFFSNLLIELIHRLAPQIRLIMSYKDAKTVSYEMVTTVLRSILIDSYTPNSSGDVELSESHQQLFTDIEEKNRLYNEYMKEHKTRVSTEDGEVPEDADADADPEPEVETTSTKKSKTASATKAVSKTDAPATAKPVEQTPAPVVVEPVPTPAAATATPAANNKKGTSSKAPSTRRTAPK
jgi:hypothetical protein